MEKHVIIKKSKWIDKILAKQTKFRKNNLNKLALQMIKDVPLHERKRIDKLDILVGIDTAENKLQGYLTYKNGMLY